MWFRVPHYLPPCGGRLWSFSSSQLSCQIPQNSSETPAYGGEAAPVGWKSQTRRDVAETQSTLLLNPCFHEKQKQNGELWWNFLNALPEFLNLHSSKTLHCLSSVPHQVNEDVTYLSWRVIGMGGLDQRKKKQPELLNLSQVCLNISINQVIIIIIIVTTITSADVVSAICKLGLDERRGGHSHCQAIWHSEV